MRKLLVRTLLVLALAQLGVALPALAQEAPPSPTAEAQQLIEQGEQLRRAGELGLALRAFERANRRSPSERALRNIAETHHALGNYAAAYLTYQRRLQQYRDRLDDTARTRTAQALAELEGLTGQIAVERFAAGARVTLNGHHMGTTPLRAPLRVNRGWFNLGVTRPGCQALSRHVEVGAEVVRISGPLLPLAATGRLRVKPAPPVASQLQVDGKPVGPLPWEGELAVGEHTLQAVGENHQSAPLKVQVQPGWRVLQLTLNPRPGSVTVKAPSPDTRIFIDRAYVGQGEWAGQLPAGNHTLVVRRPGYPDHRAGFLVQPGARLLLRPAPPAAAAVPVGPPARPAEPPARAVSPPRTLPEPAATDDAVGVYGAVLFAGMFGVASTHQYGSDCPAESAGGSCDASAPIGGGLGLRLGYSFGTVGIEALALGALDVSQARATLPVSIPDPIVREMAEQSTHVRLGGILGLGVRALSKPRWVRFTLGGTLAYTSRRVFSTPDSYTGSSLAYSAPTLLLDGGLLLGSTPGAKFYLGLFGWFEFSGDVTLQRDASALEGQASRIPLEWRQMEVYQGTQVFVGPLLGIGFGH
jgi:hypothetical protein